MKTVYRSKFGWAIFLPTTIILIALSVLMIASQASWLGLAIVALTFAWMLHIFLNTHYTIENNTLTIVCGFMYRKQVDIQAITRVRETNNILSSPAPSLDRLEITWGKNARVMVSPKDKSGFVLRLQSIQPKINYTKK